MGQSMRGSGFLGCPLPFFDPILFFFLSERRLSTMADTDLIARVYPYKDDLLLLHAQNAIENSLRCMPPIQQREKAHQSRSSRESTESREDSDNTDTLPYLELRFSDPPRTSSGLVFGTDTNICDVVLPNVKGMGISKRHFALTYKNQFADGCSRLIVRDLGSRHGTIVTYDGKGGTPRSEFDWIIDGFRLPNETETLIVQLHETLMFQIIVARHDITSPAYANNVERFYQGAADA
jgi:serine/threonine-protein kinase Chk2